MKQQLKNTQEVLHVLAAATQAESQTQTIDVETDLLYNQNADLVIDFNDLVTQLQDQQIEIAQLDNTAIEAFLEEILIEEIPEDEVSQDEVPIEQSGTMHDYMQAMIAQAGGAHFNTSPSSLEIIDLDVGTSFDSILDKGSTRSTFDFQFSSKALLAVMVQDSSSSEPEQTGEYKTDQQNGGNPPPSGEPDEIVIATGGGHQPNALNFLDPSDILDDEAAINLEVENGGNQALLGGNQGGGMGQILGGGANMQDEINQVQINHNNELLMM